MTRTGDFWSRRREAVRAEAKAEEVAHLASAQAKDRAELEDRTDDEILAKLELPNPDELEAGDDFSKFMARAVPERLRRRALRKLWLSNPLLANVDGLVDYGEDFTDSALVVENLQTAYQVGKGMLKHVMEMERQSEAEEDETADVADASELVDEPESSSIAAVDNSETEREAAAKASDADMPEVELADETVTVPRRMKFTFEPDAA